MHQPIAMIVLQTCFDRRSRKNGIQLHLRLLCTMMKLRSLVLLAVSSAYCQQHAGGFPPVYCPADVLTACPPPDEAVERCSSNRTWHGIDSLELYELTKVNDTALRIRSLNSSFDDTIARVIIEPLAPPPAPVPGHPHYGDPKTGCLPDEEAVSITGLGGVFCSPACTPPSDCPADVPAGVTAAPSCALQSSSGGKRCALTCSPTLPIRDQQAADAQCGANATCKAISGTGICTYDDDGNRGSGGGIKGLPARVEAGAARLPVRARAVPVPGATDASGAPLYCSPNVRGTGSNCTTRLQAYFSDSGQVVATPPLETCGLVTWDNHAAPLGQWIHSDLGRPAKRKSMCKFQRDAELYHEVGTYGASARFFTLDRLNASAVRVHSVNASFPDAVASLYEVGSKVVLRATLFDGAEYRGVLRANGAGTLGCCESKTGTNGTAYLTNCADILWWRADGTRSCWETTMHPPGNSGQCNE